MGRPSGAFLAPSDLESELACRPGLIPVGIDSGRETVSWLDLEQYHFYQGLFGEGVEFWSAVRGSAPARFSSSLSVLSSLRAPQDSLPPTAFIFHAARCGSTLLAQVLARSRENMVFSEAPPHNQIWRRKDGRTYPYDPASLASGDADVYRNLFRAMGRRRLASYRAHIVKFTSFHILRFHQIRKVFPGVPALFLFREPGAIVESFNRTKPMWMGMDPDSELTPATPEAAVEAYFRAAIAIQDPDFRCLDYSRLTPESLGAILTFFGLNPSPRELRLMRDGFDWDAQSGGSPRPFRPRVKAEGGSAGAVPEALQELYERLKRRTTISQSAVTPP